MKQDTYNCFCCTPDMTALFQGNRAIATFSTAALASTVLGSYSVSSLPPIKRRDFVKMTGFALGAGLATLSGYEKKQSADAQDPRQVEPDKIKDIPVLETWMNGKQVFKA